MKALPGMGAIFAVLALVTYVAAVMATNMFGDTDNEEVALLFGDLPSSAYSLFQVMTMDGWRFEVVQKVIDDGHPYAWLFFVPFIMVTTFAVVNLLVGLIVNSMQDAHHAEDEVRTDAYRDEVLERLESIERRLTEQQHIKK